MCGASDMNRWTEKHDLILNRIAIINQIHGCRYDYEATNACVVSRDGVWYYCSYFGCELCRWRRYDLDGVSSVFDKLDAMADVLWRVRRAGMLVA